MLDSFVAEALTSLLGQYIELNPDALKLSIAKGEVTLNNLSLRRDAFNRLNLPISITTGSLQFLHVKLLSLFDLKVQIDIDNVIALCLPQKEFTYNQKEAIEKELKRKLERIEEFESFTKLTNGKPGTKVRLIRKLLEGLIVSITNVHIKYKDNDDYIGVKINEITFANAKVQPNGIIRKEAVIGTASLYAGKGDLEFNDPIPKKNIITTISELTVIIDFIQKHYKQVRAYIKVPIFKGVLTQMQYQEFLSVVSRLSEYAQAMKFLGIRPQKRVIGNEKAWWKFAVEAIKNKRMNEENKGIREDVIKSVEEKYTEVYIKWRNDNKTKDLEEVKRMDDKLREEEVIYLRKKALKKAAASFTGGWKKKMMGMKKEEMEALCQMLDSNETKIDDKEEVLHIEAELEFGEVSLNNNDQSRTILCIIASKIDFKCIIYGKGFHVGITCDYASINEKVSAYPEVLKKSVKELPLVKCTIDRPITGPDAIINVRVAGTELCINKILLMNLYQFFMLPEQISLSQVKYFVEQQLTKFYQITTHRLDDFLTDHQTTVQLDVEVVAPTITVPLFFNDSESPFMKMKLGQIRIITIENPIGQKFAYILNNVSCASYPSFKNSSCTDDDANYIIQSISGNGEVLVGEPNRPFIDIITSFKPFVSKISKAKIDLIKEYINEYTDGWDELIVPKQCEQEESLDDVEFLKQQRGMVKALLKRVATESVHIKAVLERFEIGIAQIGDSSEKKMVTKLVVENVGFDLGIKANGFDCKAEIGSIELEDHVNRKPQIPFIFSSKIENCSQCYLANIHVGWGQELISVQGTIQIGRMRVVIQPKVISELIKYGMSLLFSYQLDNRSLEEKRKTIRKGLLTLKESKVIEDEINTKNDIIKKSESIKEKSSIQNPRNKILNELKRKIEIELKVIVEECGLCLIEDSNVVVCNMKVQGIETGVQWKGSPTIDLSIRQACIFEYDVVGNKEQPVLIYQGKELLVMKYNQTRMKVSTKNLIIHNVFMKLNMVQCFICPSFITRSLKIIGSDSIIKAIDLEQIHKQIVRGFISFSNNFKTIVKSISIKSRGGLNNVNLFNPKIELNSPHIRLFKDYSSGNYSVNASVGIIIINSLINVTEDKINQEIELKVDKCNVTTTQKSEVIPIISNLSINCNEKTNIEIGEDVKRNTKVECVVKQLLQVNIKAKQVKFLIDYFFEVKEKLDIKTLMKLFGHIKTTRARRAIKSEEYTQNLDRSTRKEKEYNFLIDVDVSCIQVMFGDINNVALASINGIKTNVKITKDLYLEGEIEVKDIIIEDARPVAEGRFHRLLGKLKEKPFLSTSIDMYLPTLQVFCQSNIESLSIVIIPSLIGDLALIGIDLTPQITKVHEKKHFVKKQKPVRINVLDIIETIVNNGTNKENKFKVDENISTTFNGNEIFLRLKKKLNISEHQTEYLCDELLRQSILIGKYPFDKYHNYKFSTSDITKDSVIFLSSFEEICPKEIVEESDLNRFIFSIIVSDISFIFVMDDENINTPYLLMQANGTGQVTIKKNNKSNFLFTINKAEWKSCQAKNGELTYQGVILNEGFDLSYHGDILFSEKLIEASTQCIFQPGKFIFSFDDLKMLLGCAKTLKKIFECVMKKLKDRPQTKKIITLATLLTNPPSFRIKGKNVYIKSTFGITNFDLILNHPLILSPLYKLTVVQAETKLYTYNDDIVINIAPLISFNFFNEKFGEYENVFNKIQADVIVRVAGDIVHGEPRLCLSVNTGFGNMFDISVTKELLDSFFDVYKELDQFNQTALGVGEYKPVRIINQMTTESSKLYANTTGTSNIELLSNTIVELPLEAKRKQIKEFTLRIRNEDIKIPLTTTITQLHVLQNKVYFFSKMTYDIDGSQLVYLITCKTIKNSLDIPIEIRLNKGNLSKVMSLKKGEAKPIPQEFIKESITLVIQNQSVVINSDELRETTLIPLDTKKTMFIQSEKITTDYEYKDAEIYDFLIDIRYAFSITNLLPRIICIGNKEETHNIDSCQTKKLFKNLGKRIQFDGEGSTIWINTRDISYSDIDYYQLKNGTTIRARWNKGDCVIDSEFLVYNKTDENIFACVGSNKILLQPLGNGEILTLNKCNLKLIMCEGISESLQSESITSGDLCINGKKKTNYIHLELSSNPQFQGIKIITITYAYHIINTTQHPLFIQCPNQTNTINELQPNQIKIIPLVLPPTKSSDIVPSFKLACNKEGPYSELFTCVSGSSCGVSLIQSSDFNNRVNLFISVRNYGVGQCVVIENETTLKCKNKIVNDTDVPIQYLWSVTNNLGLSTSVDPHTETTINIHNIIDIDHIVICAPFLKNQYVSYSLKKLKFYEPIISGTTLFFAYTFIIDGITTLTFTCDQLKVMRECPLFILSNNPDLSTTGVFEVPIINFSFKAPIIGIDIIDQRRVELCYGKLINLTANVRINAKYSEVVCDVESVQIDCDEVNTQEEVFLSIQKTSLPAIHFSTQVIQSETSQNFFYFPFINVLVQPVTVALESKFIADLYQFFKSLHFKIKEIQKEVTQGIPPMNSSIYTFIRSLVLQPIVLYFSCSLQPSHLVLIPYNAFTAVLHALGSSLLNIRDSIIKLNATVAKNVNGDLSSLKQIFVEHYYKQIINQAILLVAYSSFLGNPRGLLNDISTGCHDFFYEPAQGLTISVSSFGKGMINGVSSLAQNATHGAASSISGITGSVSTFVASFSFDKAYIEKRNSDKRAKSTGDGIRKGFVAFSSGVFQGITGVVYQPIKGAIDGGITGFISGVGKGFVGLVTKPIVGTIDLVTKTADGVRASTGKMQIERIRDIRTINPKYSLKPYDRNEAFLSRKMREDNLGNIITSYISNGPVTWVLAEKRFIVYSQGKLNPYHYSLITITKTPDGLFMKCSQFNKESKLIISTTSVQCKIFLEFASDLVTLK
ncbi:hypothetical protein EHI8A_004220 [Entamoeba histolytica HM-1:IMSS-B]|uniref:Vacuolar protein sorting-associated protein n=4 Tax=Entamoeba histolytica TaxID=5759 RepID=C4LTP4_ENTH1|nr:hypothetical protein, conserved [Entamoeba histolytica HM-1:IMSS]EAL49934.1 hypothetical protein, conserved [Entamoeba histolytica HM-1:IMSS]EMH72066.1 hypothetical protein EHI8A_004220 [Entamoeba histolytica HM-1:IMSS-B]ENY65897.1 vacuolar protein sorting-associated protein, putative [Entamoeba histolytica HM-1:IMSS-A]GAT91946.1 hypothetical protein conserved [Entamoeba histolytica]|eukprot:XP_655320.1 hypothetical protein, conserved [Entamoeba histolytica HM-1:IMSS]